MIKKEKANACFAIYMICIRIRIWLLLRFRDRFERFRRFAKGENSFYAPVCPIWLLFKFRVMLERFRRFSKGDNRDYESLIKLFLRLSERLDKLTKS